MDVLFALALLAIATLSLTVVAAPPLLLRSRGCWAARPVGLWAAAVVLLAMWIGTELRGAVRADETDTSSHVLEGIALIWWSGAVVVGMAAVVLAARVPARRPPVGTQHVSPALLVSLVVALLACYVIMPLAALVPAIVLLNLALIRIAPGRAPE